MKKIIDKKEGGWQFKIEYKKGEVVKTPRNINDIRKKIHKYLASKKRLNEKEKIAKGMINDILYATKIIKKTKVPRKLLADLEFLENGKIKQKRVIVLSRALNDADYKSAKKIIRDYIKLIKKLWEYGIQEKPMKFHSNYGLYNGKVVLIDPFEITSDKKRAKRIIKKKRFDKLLKKDILKPKITEFLVKELKKELTNSELDRLWKKRLNENHLDSKNLL
jgi:hypothetical protein